MHNQRGKPAHYNSFREVGEQMNKREPTPQEHNAAQLMNILGEIKQAISKVASDLQDYRLRHADERMHMREFMTNMAKDRSNTAALLEAIVDHLTAPPQQPVDRRNPIENSGLPNFEIPGQEIKQAQSMLEAARQMMPAAVEQAMPIAIDNAIKPNKRKIFRLKDTNLEDFIFNLLEPHETQPYDSDAIWNLINIKMPQHNISRTSIMPTLSRLTAAGKLERVERGKYRVLKS